MSIDNNASGVWKNVLKGRDELKKHLTRQIANGKQTNLWKDPWLKRKSLILKLGWDALSSMGGHDSKVDTIITDGRRTQKRKGLQVLSSNL